MATKIKSERKTVRVKDVRKHELADFDYDYTPTDSTCPFKTIVDQLQEPGFEYMFAYNSPERIDRLYRENWVAVSPERLNNKRTFSDLKNEQKLYITSGDTVLLERDKRYGDRERSAYEKHGLVAVDNTLKNLRLTDVRNPRNPFSNDSFIR